MILLIAIQTLLSSDSKVRVRIGYVDYLASPDEGVLLRIADLSRAICIDGPLDVCLLLCVLRGFQSLEQGIDTFFYGSVSLFGQSSSISNAKSSNIGLLTKLCD